jgi:tetratricopeptide (TPR) repeat protein
MGDIVKLPVQVSKPGYRRVRKRAHAESSNQLDLFSQNTSGAEILEFAPAGVGAFEHALLCDEHDDPRAGALYAKAIEENDHVTDALCNLGIIASKLGNSVKALDCFSKCLSQDPRHCEAHYNLANLYFDLNDFRLAQLHFELAAQIEPGFANALFNLALVQSINNEPGAALSSLAKYKELASDAEVRIVQELLATIEKSLPVARNGMPSA